MALKLKCACGERLSAPESAAGKRGKCPKCGMKFVVPGPKVATVAGPSATSTPQTSPPTDDFGLDLPDLGGGSGGGALDDLFDEAFDEPVGSASALDRSNPFASPQTVSAPTKKRRVGSRQGLNRLANAIKLVFWGTLGTVFSAIATGAFGALSVTAGELALVLVLLGSLAVIGFTLMSMVGRILCLVAPTAVGKKPLVGLAVLCDLSGMSLVLGMVLGWLPPGSELVANLLGCATLILFVLYLWSVAHDAGEASLSRDATTVIVTLGVGIASIILMFVTPIAGLVVFGAMLYGTYKYLKLLQYMAEQLRR